MLNVVSCPSCKVNVVPANGVFPCCQGSLDVAGNYTPAPLPAFVKTSQQHLSQPQTTTSSHEGMHPVLAIGLWIVILPLILFLNHAATAALDMAPPILLAISFVPGAFVFIIAMLYGGILGICLLRAGDNRSSVWGWIGVILAQSVIFGIVWSQDVVDSSHIYMVEHIPGYDMIATISWYFFSLVFYAMWFKGLKAEYWDN